MNAGRAAVLSAAAALLLYAPTLRHGFTWDDHLYVEGSPFVRDPANLLTLLSPRYYWENGPAEAGGRPLFLASLLADRALWGERAAGYHLTNILLHAACAGLLAALAAAWTGSAVVALAAGLLFAVHPLTSEVACAVSFRPDALAALFFILALLADARARVGGRAAARQTAAGAAAFGLALLGKENAVLLPLVLVMAWRGSDAEPAERRRRGWALALSAAVLALYAGFRAPRGGYASMRAAAPAAGESGPAGAPGAAPFAGQAPVATSHYEPSAPEWTPEQRRAASRMSVAASAFALYARLLVWPWPLVADRAPPAPGAASAALGLVAAAALAAAGWAARRRLPAASSGIVWFFAALAPASGLVALHNPVAERYLYLPLAGLVLATAAGAHAAARRWRPGSPDAALAILLAIPVSVSALLTSRRVPAWRSDATLFADVRLDDSSRRLYNRARLEQEAGRTDEAAAAYRRSAAANPGAAEPRVNLAALEDEAGRKGRALALLREAVSAAPRSPVAREALGVALERAGRRTEALEAFAEGARLDPRSASLRRRHGAALLEAGRAPEALYEAEAAVALDPTAASYYLAGRAALELERLAAAEGFLRRARESSPGHAGAAANLGVVLHRAGRLGEARVALEDAKRLAPAAADARRSLGVVLDDLGHAQEAERELTEAVRLDPRYADAWHALGVVRQKRGRLTQAEAAYRRAAELAPARVESASNLAGLLNARGEAARALLLLDAALAREPGRPALLHNRADALMRLGRVEEAAPAYEAAVTASRALGDPAGLRAPSLTGLALCRLRQGRAAEALALAREASAADPGYLPALEVERRAAAATP